MIRVLLADDQALVRAGFRMILKAEPGIEVAGEAGDGSEAVARAQELSPDVVLMDVRMPEMNGIEATRRIVDGQAAPRVDFVAHARSLGAQAEGVSDIKTLSSALERALRGRKTSVIVIETDPRRGTDEGGAWWDVAVTAAPRTSGCVTSPAAVSAAASASAK